MENIPGVGPTASFNGKLSRSPSKAPLSSQPGSFSASTRRMPQSSSRSLVTTPPLSRSGRSAIPVQMMEMSVTEQIARKARKSTVLDDKNALLILAIPDYDDYKIMQPYSCRSLSNKSKFVGGKDFITRHNPQEVSEFKKQYSRDVGNLNRHRSILAPPTTAGASQLLAGGSSLSLSSSSSLALFASQSILSSPSKTAHDLNSSGGNEIWRQALTASQKPCWVLTEFGIETLIGPEYRIATRVPMLPALNQQNYRSSSSSSTNSSSPFVPSLRSPLRPETPLSSFTERESARIGFGVNLLDEKQLASLSRTAAYSPKSRPSSPPRSLYRASAAGVGRFSSSGAMTERSPSKVHQFGNTLPANRPVTDDGTSGLHRSHPSPSTRDDDQAVTPSWSLLDPSPTISPPKAPTSHSYNNSSTGTSSTTTLSTGHAAPSPITQPFAMEISPPRVNLGTLRRNEVYLFPVRVRNVGFKQERFRVKHVSATCAGFEAAIAEASYDKEAARLAPGLAAILTLTLCFQHPGKIYGRVQVETEGVGCCEVEIRGGVR